VSTQLTLELDGTPATRAGFIRDLRAHSDVLVALARNDFHARYRRATFGVLWAVAVPLVQAGVLAAVLSRVVAFDEIDHYAAYVLTGMLPWSYLAAVLATGGSAVVDGADLATKVWFPRAVLPLVPVVAGALSLGISMAILVCALPLLGAGLGPSILLLVPACALLVVFSATLALVVAALHVYFRDVRYLVQAGLLVWFYATPVFYPADLVDGALRVILDLNPATGIITVFRMAAFEVDDWQRPVVGAIVATALLTVLALELYRRLDRVLVDRL
jgi:ABC-2 type transport system permease protein